MGGGDQSLSRTVDERVVEMKFDNSKFENNVQTTMSTLDKLKSALKLEGATSGFESINAAAKNVTMDGITGACETVQAKFSAMQVVAMTVLANMTNDAIEAGKKIFSALTVDGARDGFAEYEQKMGSVQTIMNGTGESLEVVMAQLEELNLYADKTIYSFADMTANIGKFTNAGVKLEDAVAAIKGVSNEAAVSGANAQEASRAMYNFAQALSAGYVKLIDWKSIENANMATVEFKNELINTALELGTLVKEEDKFITTTTDAKGKISEAFDATSMFNESLSHEWMTTEVLTKTLGRYADENTEIGKKATEAATKVRTFTMMMDTLKEAIGSGWAITWETIIGDFNQATDLFTEATDTLSDIIGKQAESRNNFLKEVMDPRAVNIRDWQSAMIGAGKYAEQYKQEVIKVAKAHGVAIDEMIEKEGSFEATLKTGWLTNDIFKDINKDIGKLAQSSEEFRELNKRITDINNPINKLSLSMQGVSGRVHIINSLRNTFEALVKIMKPVKEAFNNIFPPKTAEDVKNMLANFEEFTKKLKISDEQAERVKNTFEGFFGIMRKGLDTVKRIAEAFSPLNDIFRILFENLLSGVESLGNFFRTMDDGKDSTSLFETVLNTIHDSLESFANNLQGYIDSIKDSWKKFRNTFEEKLNTPALAKLSELLEKIKESLSGFKTSLSDGLKKFFETVTNAKIDGTGVEKIISVLNSFASGLGKIFSEIGNLLAPIGEKLKSFFSDVDYIDGIATSISAGGIAAVAAMIGRFIDNILDLKDQVGFLTNPVETICGLVQQLTDLFGSLEESLRVSVVKDFALSVGILAASIWLLASIDPKRAAASVTIITGLMGEVVYLFKLMKKIGAENKTASKNITTAITGFIDSMKEVTTFQAISNAMLKMAAAILILATAMKMISSIDPSMLWQSFTVIALLVGELAGITYALSKNQAKMMEGTSALIALSSAVMILSISMKILASIEWDSLIASGIALVTLIGALTLATKMLSGSKGVEGSAALIAMSSAIMILSVSLKVLSSIPWPQLITGMITIAAALGGLMLALKFMPDALPGAAALLVASAALLVLSGALKVIETIKADNVGTILKVIGGVLAELALGLTLMMAALPGASALLIASAAIAILTPVLIALGAVPAENIKRAIGEVALALLAFGGIGAILGFVSPLILAFAVALGVLSAAVIGMGAGIALAGAGLTALATSMGLVAEIGKEAAERIVETLKIILTGLITTIPDMVLAVGEGIVKICELIANSGPTIKKALATIVEVIIDVFTEKLPQITEAFISFLANLMQQIATYAPQIADSFYSMIIAILEVFASKIPDLVKAGIDIMVAIIEGIQETQNALIDAGMQAIINFINGLADSIDKYTPELVKATKRLFDAIIDAMLYILTNGNPKLYAKAKEMMDKFRSGISEKITTIVLTVSNMITSVLRVFADKVEDFRNAALNLMAGFINGLKEKAEEAKNAISGVAGSVVTRLKSSLAEHSPSKISDKIGQYFTIGFANGIVDSAGKAVEAADTLAGSVIRALQGVNEMVEDELDTNPVIRPVLDLSEVEADASRLGEMSKNWNDVTVGVSGNLANVNASAMNSLTASNLAESQNGLDLLRSAISAISSNEPGTTQNNTFNITGDNPKEIANEVSRILQKQVERRGAAWA